MKKITRVFAMLLAVLMLSSIISAPAQAATNITAVTSYKKAHAVVKGRTYTVNCASAGKNYYVKFKAPSAGTYKFTFTATKNIKKSDFYTNIHLCKASSYGPILLDFYTQGGKASCMFMATYGWWNKYDRKTPVSTSQFRYTRTATKKLSKGQTVYINNWSTSAKVKNSYSLKIVKK